MTDPAALQEPHRLLTALMIERAGGSLAEGSCVLQVPADVLSAARELPLLGCFVDEDAGALVVDLDEREQARAPEHRRTLRRLLGDLPLHLRYGRHEDHGPDSHRSEP